MSKKYVHVGINSGLHAKLKRLAKKKGVTLTALVNEIVKRKLGLNA